MKILALIALFAVVVSAQNDCTPLRCTLPMKPGDCQDKIQQYYFDNSAKKCKTFTYTGCGGNVNRFRTLQLCENTCLKTNCPSTTTTRRTTTTTKKPATTTKSTTTSTTSAGGSSTTPSFRCGLKLETGDCQESITRWYYDAATKQCKSFIYTGCRANANNFLSKANCEKTCVTA